MGKLRLSIVAGVLAAFVALPAVAASYSNQDCSANAMIHCGFSSQADLQSKLQHGDGVQSGAQLQNDFRAAGMDMQAVSSSSMVSGTVRKDGTVWVNGKKVATNAQSFGRQNISGSTRVGNLWRRPTSVSLQSSSMPMLIVMKNGQFSGGVMPWCGNVVMAKPVPVAKKPAAKKQVAPVSQVQTQTQTQSQTQNQTVNITAPVQTVAASPAQPTPLPQTGTSRPIEGLAAAGSISAAVGALIRSRQRLQSVLSSKITL